MSLAGFPVSPVPPRTGNARCPSPPPAMGAGFLGLPTSVWVMAARIVSREA